MPSLRLTELIVARARAPAEGRATLWDTTLPGFGLELTASGRRSWLMEIQKNGEGNLLRFNLGEAPALSLADARAKARALIHHPDLVIEVVGMRAPAGLLERSAGADRGNAGAVHRAVACTPPILDPPEQAIRKVPPTADPERTKRKARERVLKDDELRAIWRAADELKWPFGPLIHLLILTAARREEISRMAWSDLDLKRRLWSLPREMRGARSGSEVPLSSAAVTIIKKLPQMGCGLVFPADRNGRMNPVSGFPRAKRRLNDLSGIGAWRLHDLRCTAATHMMRLGQPEDVVTGILNQRTVRATASDRRRRIREMRAAIEVWERELRCLLAET